MRHNDGMFVSVPDPTPADLNFSLAGVPVRVSAWFWLGSLLLGWGLCLSVAGGDQRELLRYLLLWCGTVLVSLLVHEMGHALAYRWFGQSARIVLHHIGGVAIADPWGSRGGRAAHRPVERLLISAAGPLAQLALAATIVAVLRTGGYAVPFPLASVSDALGLDEGRPIGSRPLAALAYFLLSVNVFWPLLNLVPVPPLDGGQIVREGLAAVGVADARRIAAFIGVVAGGLVAWWGYTHGEPYLGIMFAMLTVSCFQSLSEDTPWRRWN